MTSPSASELEQAMLEALTRLERLHTELLESYPPFRNTLAISGMLIGHGLGSFVANGLSDDQIAAYVSTIVSQIRQTLSRGQVTAPGDQLGEQPGKSLGDLHGAPLGDQSSGALDDQFDVGRFIVDALRNRMGPQENVHEAAMNHRQTKRGRSGGHT